jgi:MoaA/NifB/PqqE/SkfB family radical SAM enzyme
MLREKGLQQPDFVTDHECGTLTHCFGIRIVPLDQLAIADFDSILLATNLYEKNMREQLVKKFGELPTAVSIQPAHFAARKRPEAESSFCDSSQCRIILSKIFTLVGYTDYAICGTSSGCRSFVALVKLHKLATPVKCYIASTDEQLPEEIDQIKCEKLTDGLCAPQCPVVLAGSEGTEFLEQELDAIFKGEALVLDLIKERNIKYSITAQCEVPFLVGGRVCIELTRRCNLRCIYCSTHSQAVNDNYANADMDFNKFKKFVPQLKGHIEVLDLHGAGEPLLYPKLPDAIVEAKKFVPKVMTVTNGVLLNKDNTRRLADTGLDSLHLSLDCMNVEYNKKVRGIDTAKVLENIEHFSKSTGIPVVIRSALSPENLDAALELYTLKKRIPTLNQIDYVTVFVWSDLKQSDPSVFGKHKWYRLEKFRRQAIESGADNNIHANLISPFGKRHGDVCHVPWTGTALQVVYDGSLTPCCALSNYTIGNVFESELMSLFNNTKMMDFRKNMLKGCYPSGCKTVCGY